MEWDSPPSLTRLVLLPEIETQVQQGSCVRTKSELIVILFADGDTPEGVPGMLAPTETFALSARR